MSEQKRLSRKEFLALPMDKRRELLGQQANNPEVIAYYEGLSRLDRPNREKIAGLRHDNFGCGTHKCPHWQKDCFNSDWVIHNGLCPEMLDQILALIPDIEEIEREWIDRLNGCKDACKISIEEAKKQKGERIMDEIDTTFSDTITKGEMVATSAWQALKEEK